MPNKALTPKNCLKVLINPVPTCNMHIKIKFATKGHLEPYLSPRYPKINAPIVLNIKTKVIPQVIRCTSVFKSSANLSTLRETVKKSKLSHVHAANPERINSHCFPEISLTAETDSINPY